MTERDKKELKKKKNKNMKLTNYIQALIKALKSEV